MFNFKSKAPVALNVGANKDVVNITAVGPKETLKFTDVDLPGTIEVKRKNLPVRVYIESQKYGYKSFTIAGKENAGACGWLGIMFPGLIGGPILTALGSIPDDSESGINAGAVAAGATLLTLGVVSSVNMVLTYSEVPEYNSYKLDYEVLPSHKSKSLYEWQLADVYSLMGDKKYDIALNVIRDLIDNKPSANNYYLQGLCYYYSDKNKKAIKSYNKALELTNANTEPALYEKIQDALTDALNKKKADKEASAQMWTQLGLSTLQTASNMIQTVQALKAQNNGYIDPTTVTDPSKLTKQQLDDMVNPQKFLQAKMAESEAIDRQYYEQFRRYCKKADGSDYTFQEYKMMLLAEEANYQNTHGQNQPESDSVISGIENENISETESMSESESNSYSSSYYSSNSSYSRSSTSNSRNSSSRDSNTSSNNNSRYKQQFKSGKVSDDDYSYVKKVTLYKRDGDKSRQFQTANLYKKGTTEYVKIGTTFFPRQFSNWSRYSNMIFYGSTTLYF